MKLAAPPPTLAARVRALEPSWSWSQVRAFIASGRVFVAGVVVRDDALRVDADAEIELRKDAAKIREGVLDAERIVYCDDHVVVVNKPSGVNTVPFEHQGPNRERDTLVDQVRARLTRMEKARGKNPRDLMVGVVQRLDRETSGVMVFARTMAAKTGLEEQIRGHTTLRRYVALVHGTPRVGTIESWLMQDRGDGLRGSWGSRSQHRGERPSDAKRAVTHIEDAIAHKPGVARIRCRLETGRQHQIRIHLAESGHPLLGERVYIRDYARDGGVVVQAERVMLHAEELGFVHPISGKDVHFAMPLL